MPVIPSCEKCGRRLADWEGNVLLYVTYGEDGKRMVERAAVRCKPCDDPRAPESLELRWLHDQPLYVLASVLASLSGREPREVWDDAAVELLLKLVRGTTDPKLWRNPLAIPE